MRKMNFSDLFNRGFVNPWNDQIVYGLLLLLLGAAIIFFSRILTFIIASVFFSIGFLLISSAWTLKTLFKRSYGFKDEFFEQL